MTCKKLKKDFTCRDHKGIRCIDVSLDECRYKSNTKKEKKESEVKD